MLVDGTKGSNRLYICRLYQGFHGRINHGYWEAILLDKALGECFVGFYDAYHHYVPMIRPAKNPVHMGVSEADHTDFEGLPRLGGSYMGEYQEKTGEDK